MLLATKTYKENYLLAEISNFNSLITYSQKYLKPVFELTVNELKQSGKVLEESEGNIDKFKEVFSNLADHIISMTNEKC
jgi:hypothetical protein